MWSCGNLSWVRILLFLTIINLLQIIIIMFFIIFIYFRGIIFCTLNLSGIISNFLHSRCFLFHCWLINIMWQFIGIFVIITIPDSKCPAAFIHQLFPSNRKLDTDFIQLLCCFVLQKKHEKEFNIFQKSIAIQRFWSHWEALVTIQPHDFVCPAHCY